MPIVAADQDVLEFRTRFPPSAWEKATAATPQSTLSLVFMGLSEMTGSDPAADAFVGLAPGGWAPSISHRRTDAMGGGGAYTSVVETLTIHIFGLDPSQCQFGLEELRRYLDQAEAFAFGEDVWPVTFWYRAKGSLVPSVFQTVVLGRAAEDQTLLSLQPTYVEDIQSYVIQNVTLSFLRRGEWLMGDAGNAAKNSSFEFWSGGVPRNWTSINAPVLADVALSGTAVNTIIADSYDHPGTHAAYILATTAGSRGIYQDILPGTDDDSSKVAVAVWIERLGGTARLEIINLANMAVIGFAEASGGGVQRLFIFGVGGPYSSGIRVQLLMTTTGTGARFDAVQVSWGASGQAPPWRLGSNEMRIAGPSSAATNPTVQSLTFLDPKRAPNRSYNPLTFYLGNLFSESLTGVFQPIPKSVLILASHPNRIVLTELPTSFHYVLGGDGYVTSVVAEAANLARGGQITRVQVNAGALAVGYGAFGDTLPTTFVTRRVQAFAAVRNNNVSGKITPWELTLRIGGLDGGVAFSGVPSAWSESEKVIIDTASTQPQIINFGLISLPINAISWQMFVKAQVLDGPTYIDFDYFVFLAAEDDSSQVLSIAEFTPVVAGVHSVRIEHDPTRYLDPRVSLQGVQPVSVTGDTSPLQLGGTVASVWIATDGPYWVATIVAGGAQAIQTTIYAERQLAYLAPR